MIELNDRTQQDFLNREWVQKLLDAGIDMSDCKYCIMMDAETGTDYIGYYPYTKSVLDESCRILLSGREAIYRMPTYTVSELLYKLNELHYTTTTLMLCSSKFGIIETLATLLIQRYKENTI